MSKKIVVIGAVALGPKVACRIKRLMPESRVTLIDRDSIISYGGCGIPYYVCGDVSDEKELRSTSFHMVRDEKFFGDAKGVNVLTRTRVTSIDRTAKEVVALIKKLHDDRSTMDHVCVKYDKYRIEFSEK